MVYINEKFRQLIMPLGKEEKELLRESLLKEGVRDALIAWNGTLLDGHNRYEICEELGLPYSVKSIELEDETAAEEWILRNQLGRRNLTDADKVRLALKLKDKIANRAQHNKEVAGQIIGRGQGEKVLANLPKPINTRQEIAKLAGVGERTVAKVEAVDKTAPAPLREAMGKTISIDRTFEMNRQVQKLPDEQRESEAIRLLREEEQKAYAEVDRKTKIIKSIHKLILAPLEYREYVTEEDVDIYISRMNGTETLESIARDIDLSISVLEELKTIFLSRNKIRRIK